MSQDGSASTRGSPFLEISLEGLGGVDVDVDGRSSSDGVRAGSPKKKKRDMEEQEEGQGSRWVRAHVPLTPMQDPTPRHRSGWMTTLVRFSK
jgi:hypothetical protein